MFLFSWQSIQDDSIYFQRKMYLLKHESNDPSLNILAKFHRTTFEDNHFKYIK